MPTKATTQHVAKEPPAPGSIDERGMQMVIDPTTGKQRFIDRKHGSVMGPSGVAVRGEKERGR